MRDHTLTLVIMADFGMGPYAWLRYPDEPPYKCGGNIADSVCGFPEEYGISKELEKLFAEWVIDFERHYDQPVFNWQEWNDSGIVLAKKLKVEVGDKFSVEYHVPMEDPSNPNGDRIIKIA